VLDLVVIRQMHVVPATVPAVEYGRPLNPPHVSAIPLHILRCVWLC
jgi:hypothetical protein